VRVGAYGNHAGETLYHACGESLAVYRCPDKKIDGYVVYTNLAPAGGIRGYGLSQSIFAVESAMDDLARALDLDPIEFRRSNAVRPGDPMISMRDEPEDTEYGSYGLDQCLDLVEDALARGNGAAVPEGNDWLVGEGIALAMHDTAPPTEHRSEARLRLGADGNYHLAVGTAEFGNGTTTLHGRVVASVLETTMSRVRMVQADTDRTGYDTGAFASTGTTVAGNAVRLAAEALRERILDFASEHSGASRDACRLDDGAVHCNGSRIPLPELVAAAQAAGQQLEVVRKAYGAPRSVALNVQGFRIAVHRVTGEIVILQSVHAAAAGVVINPMQVRAQVEGSVAQGLGWALYERMVFDEEGRVVNPTFRNYRIPAFADVPHTEVLFADTHDTRGPLGAKGMGECPINPVSPALANALADATGLRFRDLPFTPDRIYRRIFERHAV
jgi:putative selenate reductase molybdopterin-binding subunit